MDRRTVERYQRDAHVYADRTPIDEDRRLAAFRRSAPAGPRLDAGCGSGRYLGGLGDAVVGLDASPSMLDHARATHPGAPLVAGDLVRLPLRHGALVGAWANKSLQHLPAGELPGALGELHRALRVGGALELQVFRGEGSRRSDVDSDLPDRLFSLLDEEQLADLLEGAGFTEVTITTSPPSTGPRPWVSLYASAVRARTLADTVGPGVRLVVCGLNPSLYAADAGVAFARPGNRFWPALQAAGLTTLDRDPAGALDQDGIGLTDLVKRATTRADELTVDEYRHGVERLTRLCRRWRPAAVCVVGLAGWRAAVDRRAGAGWQGADLAGTPVYLMPSTSGLNAHDTVASLAGHLRRAADGPPSAAPGPATNR